jgi:prolyl 4-hydroxylase
MSTATAQVITPELRKWIIQQAEAGCRPQDVI